MRRIVIAHGRPGDRRRGQPDRRVPGRARPRRPGQPVASASSRCPSRSPPTYTGLIARVDRVRGGRQADWRAGAGGDARGRRPGLAARPTAARSTSATSASTPPRSPRPASSAQRDRVSVLAPKAMESNAVKKGRLLAAGILAGFFVLAFTFALLVSRSLQRQIDSFLQAARRLGSRRLHGRGADLGPRRVRGAGRGVQQDVAPARGAPGGAQPGARPPAGRDAPHRRDVRGQPRPRGPAGDRRQDRGRRGGRRRRAARPCAPTRTRRSSRWR